MTIRNLIRRPIIKLPPTASCTDAAAVMRDQRVGAVLVSDADVLLGIITDRDIVTRVVGDRLDARAVTLDQVMTRNPVYLPDSCSLDVALRTMRELGIRRVPVMGGDKIEGMLSLDDVLVSLGRQLAEVGNVAGEATGRSKSS